MFNLYFVGWTFFLKEFNNNKPQEAPIINAFTNINTLTNSIAQIFDY